MNMSHTVTVTRTTTSTTTSAIIINTGYLKTWPGVLKFFELILGIVVVGLVAYYFDRYKNYVGTPEVFFLLMAVTFLIGTFLLLISCLISISTASIISKTIYEVVYHGFAFVLYLAASLTFVTEINTGRTRYSNDYEPYMAAVEVVYHGFAFVLYLAASLTFVIEVNNRRSRYSNDYEPYMAAAIIGFVISILYLLSTIFAMRSYRGL